MVQSMWSRSHGPWIGRDNGCKSCTVMQGLRTHRCGQVARVIDGDTIRNCYIAGSCFDSHELHQSYCSLSTKLKSNYVRPRTYASKG